MTMKLYCFGESGHSYKAALALELGGQDWTPVHIDFFAGGTRAADYANLNVMAEAPTLIDGETTLSQSGAILAYLSDKTGQFGGAVEDRYEVLRWVLWDNHKLSSQAGMLRFQMNFLPEAKRDSNVIKFMSARLVSAYKVLESRLNSRDWIVGDGPTNADFSCCSYLFYPEDFGFERRDWPNTDRWLNKIAGLKGWKHPYDLMQRAFPT